MDATERLNALDLALGNEMSEREFYLKHAERTRNPLGRAMFQQIADEELEHYQRLNSLYERWKYEEKWPETIPLEVHATQVRNTINKVVSAVTKMDPADDDDLEALRIAIDFEYKGAEVYARLRDSMDQANEKAFFALLSSIEREHYLSLKDAEEYLTDPESWYARHERHGLDGA